MNPEDQIMSGQLALLSTMLGVGPRADLFLSGKFAYVSKCVPGGDVWVLVIKDAKSTDSGIYVCEVNSNPVVQSFHKLSGRFSTRGTS